MKKSTYTEHDIVLGKGFYGLKIGYFLPLLRFERK